MISMQQIPNARSYSKQLLQESRTPTIDFSLSSDLCCLLSFVIIKTCLEFGRKSSKVSPILSTTTLLLNWWRWDTPPVDCSQNHSQRIVLIQFKTSFSQNSIISPLSLIFHTLCSLSDTWTPSKTTIFFLMKSLSVLWRLFKMQLHYFSSSLMLFIQSKITFSLSF